MPIGDVSGTIAGYRGSTGAQRQAELRAQSKARRELTAVRGERKEAQAEEQRRYKAGLADIAEMTGLFGPEYTAGMEHAALTGARQSLIGRGLGGTTRPMAVGAGLKAHFESLRRGKLAGALAQSAAYKRTPPLIYPGGGEIGTALGNYLNILQRQGTQTVQPIQYGGGAAPLSEHPSQMAMAESYDIGGFSGVPTVDFSLPSGGQPMPIGTQTQRAYANLPALMNILTSGAGGAGTTGYSTMPRGTGKITAGGQTTYF